MVDFWAAINRRRPVLVSGVHANFLTYVSAKAASTATDSPSQYAAVELLHIEAHIGWASHSCGPAAASLIGPSSLSEWRRRAREWQGATTLVPCHCARARGVRGPTGRHRARRPRRRPSKLPVAGVTPLAGRHYSAPSLGPGPVLNRRGVQQCASSAGRLAAGLVRPAEPPAGVGSRAVLCLLAA